MSLYDTRAIDKVKVVMMKGESGGGGGGASALTDLSDVNITSPSDGQALEYNSTSQKWQNKSLPSALTYTCTILSMSGNDITTTNNSTQGNSGNIIMLTTGNYHGTPTTVWRLGFTSITEPTKWYYVTDRAGQGYSEEIKANTTLLLYLYGTEAFVIDVIEDQVTTEYGLTFTASVTGVANDRIAATSPDDESGKIGNIILVNTGSYSGSTTNGWGLILSHTTAGLPTFISALYDLSGNAYTEDIEANTTLVIQIRPASVDGIATLITVIGESSGGGGGYTSNVRYNVVTKSTGGWDAAITVKKYVDNVLESSLDYLYTDLTTTVNFDDCFTIYYNGADYIYTLLKDSTTHTSGYTNSWAYSDDVDFEDTFVIEKIIYTMAGAGKAVSENNHVITTDIELTRQPVSGDRFLLYCESIYSSPTGIIVDVNGTPTTIDFSVAVTNLQGICLLKVISFGATLGLLVDYISKQLTAGRGITISSGQINNALVDTLGNVTAGGNITDGQGNVLAEVEALEITQSGNPIAVKAVGIKAKDVVVTLEPIQSGSGDPSPSNIRPITGRTQTSVTTRNEDNTESETATVTLGQTVYGGIVDFKTGKVIINKVSITLDGTQEIRWANWQPKTNSVGWIYYYDLTNNSFALAAEIPHIISDSLPTISYSEAYGQDIAGISAYIDSALGIVVRSSDTSLTTATAINAYLANHPIQVVYELATPTEITVSPATLTLLSGYNYITADGNMEITLIPESILDEAKAYTDSAIAAAQNNYLEQTVTLSTSAETTATFTSAKITANSLIDLAVSEWGLIPSNVVVASGTCTVTLPKVDSAHSVVVRIYVR